MSSLKHAPGGPAGLRYPLPSSGQGLAAALLLSASAALERLSRRLAPAAAAEPVLQPRLEFYADSGAPEGALYFDGKLVGWLPGVRRL